MELLGRMLGLDAPPRRIESYDISNQGADDIVASMTVFVHARPLKRDYRHFKLRDLEHADDYASMEQVLTRRFRRYLDGDEKFGDLPDVLFIDGGENHARVAVRVLEAHGLDIPVFGMVKDFSRNQYAFPRIKGMMHDWIAVLYQIRQTAGWCV